MIIFELMSLFATWQGLSFCFTLSHGLLPTVRFRCQIQQTRSLVPRLARLLAHKTYSSLSKKL